MKQRKKKASFFSLLPSLSVLVKHGPLHVSKLKPTVLVTVAPQPAENDEHAKHETASTPEIKTKDR